MPKHIDTQFKDTRPNGDNKDQGQGGGDDQRPTTSAKGGAIAPDVATDKSNQGDHLSPKREDVAGPRTAERGGHSRIGHQPHNPAEAKDKAGSHLGNDRVQTKK